MFEKSCASIQRILKLEAWKRKKSFKFLSDHVMFDWTLEGGLEEYSQMLPGDCRDKQKRMVESSELQKSQWKIGFSTHEEFIT